MNNYQWFNALALCTIILAGTTTGLICKVRDDHIHKIKTYERKNKPDVIRVYKTGVDDIYVEDSDNSRNYVPIDKYLEGITNKIERDREFEEIKEVCDL